MRNYHHIRLIPFLLLLLLQICNSQTFAQLKIISPSTNDTLLCGKNCTIAWSGANAPVSVFYSTNHGLDWSLIQSGVETNSIPWQVPWLDSLNISFKIEETIAIQPYLLWEIPKAHSAEIRSCTVSPDGNYLLSASADFYVRIWDINTKKCVDSLLLPTVNVWQAKFYHNSDTILIAADSAAVLWYRKYNSFQWFGKHYFAHFARACDVSPLSNEITLGSYDGTSKIFSMPDLQEIAEFICDDTSMIYTTCYSSDGSQLMFSGYSGDIYIYDVSSHQLLKKIPSNDISGAELNWTCAFSKNGQYIAASGVNPNVYIYDLLGDSVLADYPAHKSQTRSVEFHPRLPVVLSASLDGYIKQRFIATGSIYADSMNHNGQILDAHYTSSGDSIVSTGRDMSIKLWRNLQISSQSDSVQVVLRYPLTLSIPHIVAKINDKIQIPLLLSGYEAIPRVKALQFSANVQIQYPSTMLSVLSQDSTSTSRTSMDTLFFSLKSMTFVDTLHVTKALTLLSDKRYEKINILKFELFDTDSLFKPIVEHGSIRIEGFCDGLTQRLVAFSNSPAMLDIKPNPVSNEFVIDFTIIENGNYELDIIDFSGNIVQKIFKGQLKNGCYSIETTAYSLSSGNFFVRLLTPSSSLIKPLIIYR